MEEAVDDAYREFLRNQGRVGELIDVDVVSAIDILVERGQWEKALMTARQQNVSGLVVCRNFAPFTISIRFSIDRYWTST